MPLTKLECDRLHSSDRQNYSTAEKLSRMRKSMEVAEKKMIKRTNASQFETLVNELSKYPEVARGGVCFAQSKADVAAIWEDISNKLNSLGPPRRLPKEWKKVWIDFKANVRAKCTANKQKLQATSGGPFEVVTLSPLEAAVEALVDLGRSINVESRNFEEIISQEPASAGSSQRPFDEYVREMPPKKTTARKKSRAQRNIQGSIARIGRKISKSVDALNDIYLKIKKEKLRRSKMKTAAMRKRYEMEEQLAILDIETKSRKLELINLKLARLSGECLS